jgi:hypothetical protein
MESISNRERPVSLRPLQEGVLLTPRNRKIVDLLRQLEYVKKQLKQLLEP